MREVILSLLVSTISFIGLSCKHQSSGQSLTKTPEEGAGFEYETVEMFKDRISKLILDKDP